MGLVVGLGALVWIGESVRRTGGFGRLFVDKPVVLALYGTGGGAGFCTACCSSASFARTSSAVNGAPSPLRSGVTEFGRAAPAWKLTFFGGGPKASGSFSEARGREVWLLGSRWVSVLLPWPTNPAWNLCLVRDHK